MSEIYWTAGIGWSAVANKANAVAGTASDMSQDVGVRPGRLYQLTVVVTRTAGAATPRIGGNLGTPMSAAGTYTQRIRSGNSDRLLAFGKDAAFAGSIDTVSCREILC